MQKPKKTPVKVSAVPNDPALAMLRLLMRTCRAKARLPVFEACAMLHSAPSQSAQVYADALLRVLSQGLSAPPVVHALSASERSFDENWLMALLQAVRQEDHASATFLLRSRLPQHYRRSVGWLATQLVKRLDLIETE